MEHEGMVHALDEIRRVLKPNGILIDLRPVEDHWLVEVASMQEIKVIGNLTDMPEGIADDEAAFRAMREVESHGWFMKEREEEFVFFYYWNTPSEMKEFMEEQWENFEKLEDDVFKAVRSAWAVANAEARIRVRVKMLITRWGKLNQNK
jgi:SAM-dependent methyltransferase